MIQRSDTLGQVAAAHPAATHIFLRHRLDFCCGGAQPLEEACHEAGLDPETVIAEIGAELADVSAESWEQKSPSELIDFILTRFHDALRRDLPGLLEAAEKVERVHAEKSSCPHGLFAHLQRMDAEIHQHLGKEEQILFPAIQGGARGPAIQMPIRVMMQEHEDHGANLGRLHELTSDFTAPPEACATWRALYSSLAKLEAELMEHIHLENNVLFPRALTA